MTKNLMTQTPAASASALTRRHVFVGAGTAGALAVAAAVLPRSQPVAPVVAAAEAAAPGTTPGYQLTEHVQRYYQTARI